MKKSFLFIIAVFVSFKISAQESLNELPCYCIKLEKFIDVDNDTELLESDVEALKKKNIYYSERRDCWAEFLVPVQPEKSNAPKEKPLPLFVAKKLGIWGYNNVGRETIAKSYLMKTNCYTIQMGRELYASMQRDTALARPFFNFLYEYYYGKRNEEIRYFSLSEMGFTVPEIDQMEEIGYAHYRVLEYQKEHPYISRDSLIREGFEAERAIYTNEISLKELEKDKYYKGKLKFDSCIGREELNQKLSNCPLDLWGNENSKILVHVDKNGLALLSCGNDDNDLVQYFCKCVSENCNLKFKPAYLFYPNAKAKVRVPCSTYLEMTEKRNLGRIAVVDVVFNNNKWEFAPKTNLPDEWKKDDMINSIQSQLGVGRTQKKKLTLNVQIIERKLIVDYLGYFPLGASYKIVSSNDKKLRF